MTVARLTFRCTSTGAVPDLDVDDRRPNLFGRVNDRLRVSIQQRGVFRRRGHAARVFPLVKLAVNDIFDHRSHDTFDSFGGLRQSTKS